MPKLILSSQQRSDLRAAAHSLKPVVQIGDKGLTEAVLKEINVHLTAHQLIKVRVAGDDREARLAVFEQICESLDAAPIHHLGKVLTLYRRNKRDEPVVPSADLTTRAVRKPNEPYTPKKLAASGIKQKKPAPQRSNSQNAAATPQRTRAAARPATPTGGTRRRVGSALSLRANARRGR